MAALGTERQTQTLPLEEKGAKAPPDFQKVYLGGKEVSAVFVLFIFVFRHHVVL